MCAMFDCVATQSETDNSIPPYFRFLNLMTFHVFLQERVRCQGWCVCAHSLCTDVPEWSSNHALPIASVGAPHDR